MRRDEARLGARICVNQHALLQVVVLVVTVEDAADPIAFSVLFIRVSTFGLAFFWFVWLAPVVCLCFYALCLFVVKFVVGNEIYLC